MMRSAHTVALAALLCCAHPAMAESSPTAPPPASAEQMEFARGLFQQGVKAFSARRYKDAVDLLLEAERAMHSPAFAYNIGIAYEAMNDVPSALRWLRSYLREVPDAEDRGQVEKMVSALEAKLQARGVQQATVLSTPDGASAQMDGMAVGVTPWTGELAPGRHRLKLQLAGHEDHEELIEVLAHRADDFVVALRPPASAAPPAARAPDESPPATSPVEADAPASDEPSALSRVSPWTWATLGGGVLALGGGLFFEMSRASAADEAQKAPQVDFRDKLDTAESRQTTARILVGVGGALVVAGGVLLALDLSSAAPAQVAIGCAGTGCYATGGGSF